MSSLPRKSPLQPRQMLFQILKEAGFPMRADNDAQGTEGMYTSGSDTYDIVLHNYVGKADAAPLIAALAYLNKTYGVVGELRRQGIKPFPEAHFQSSDVERAYFRSLDRKRLMPPPEQPTILKPLKPLKPLTAPEASHDASKTDKALRAFADRVEEIQTSRHLSTVARLTIHQAYALLRVAIQELFQETGY